MIKPIVYSISDFRQTMQPNIYKDGVARIEHFDTITGQLVPHRALVLSTATLFTVSSVTADVISKFINVAGTLYCLCVDDSSPATTHGIGIWETSGFTWTGTAAPGSFGSTGAAENVLIYYNDFILGLWKGTHIYSMETDGTFNGTYKALSYTVGTARDPIVHSKDNVLYIPYGNKLATLNSAGTLTSDALTFPTNFQIQSIAEQEDFLNIVGHDTKTGFATSYVWDRDSSLTTLTAKYDLGTDIPHHNFCPGGIPLVIMARPNSSASPSTEKPVLVVKTLRGDKMESLHEFRCESLAISTYGKYIDGDKIYFTALVKMYGDVSAKNVLFSVDHLGRLIIEQNIGVDTGTAVITGVIRFGDGFWLGGGSDGAWNTTTTYTTVSSFTTPIIKSDDLSKSLTFIGATILCEKLPASGQILLRARVDDDITDGTDFTTIGTFTTAGNVKFVMAPDTAVNIMSTLSKAKQVQLRLESTVGAVITGFQAVFTPLADEAYG